MKRFSRAVALAVVGMAVAAVTLYAGDPRGLKGDRSDQGLGSTERCLSSIELSADQKTAIHDILESHRAALHADVEAMKASERKLDEDLARRADKCVLGQDLLDKQAKGERVRAAAQDLRTRILTALTAEQQASFNACAEARRGVARHPEPRPTP